MPSPPLALVQSLSPRIAILTSDDVIISCEANGCTGLEELLRPWEGATERVSILSSTLTPAIHPTFPLRFVRYPSIFPSPETASLDPEVVVDLIGSAVTPRIPDEEQHYPLTRSLLLTSRAVTAHETFNHPVGILLAVSTSTPDPLGTMQRLLGRAIGPMSQAVPWMDGVNVMRLFVVIHDVSRMGEDLTQAQELLAAVKKAHGPHSTLLVLNSQVEIRSPPQSPDITTHPTMPLPRPFTPDQLNPSALSQVYASALSSYTLSPLTASEGSARSPTKPARRKLYGAKLSAEDTQRLAALVRELVTQSLVPWMEARIREWNEVWQSNRRGITGRLFGAGRKFFGSRPASPAAGAAPVGYNTVKGYYPVTAVEAVTRRLADFAFMLRDYKFASTVYDSLRRDHAQDRAWRYAASSTEFYGLSLLLSHPYFQPSTPPIPPQVSFTNSQHTDISSWLEQSVLAYQSRAPVTAIQLDAMRITVLYYEAWKAIGEWRGVGLALVRAAGEADEVPSAVLIEEAAGADVKGGKSQRGRRRRAFHLVIAARRYETAGLKTYSRRCLNRASEIYRSAPWTAAQDMIEYSLGRQAYTLGESGLAVEHFLRLLRKDESAAPGSQGMILEDLTLAYEQLASHPEQLAASSDKLTLASPLFDIKATRITTASTQAHASSSGSKEGWSQLEMTALAIWDRKGKKPMSLLDGEKRLSASVGESLQVELTAVNPLNSPLHLTDLNLKTSTSDHLDVETIAEITLAPYETRKIQISITSTTPNTFEITSVSYLFHRFLPCSESLGRRGKRLFATKAQKVESTYGEDTSLVVEFVEASARIEVALDIDGVSAELFEGEEVEAVLRVKNVGKFGVDQVQLVTSEIGVVRLRDRQSVTGQDFDNRIPFIAPIPLHMDTIQPGTEITIPIFITATRVGEIELLGLIIASNVEDDSKVAVASFTRRFNVQPVASCSTSGRPARDGGGYLVGVEIVNVSPAGITLEKIIPVSRSWAGKALETPLPISLYPNQSHRSYLSVSLNPDASNFDFRQKDVVDKLGRLLDGETFFTSTTKGQVTLVDPPSHAMESYLTARSTYRSRQVRSDIPIPLATTSNIFPLVDPLDLDVLITYTIAPHSSTPRKGHILIPAVRPAPEFSIVEDLRSHVEGGAKQGRTMYEETGRLRRVLVDSILDGKLAREDDPVFVRVQAGVKGKVTLDPSTGNTILPVQFDLRNQSPVMGVRWVLHLPTGGDSGSVALRDNGLSEPRYTGVLEHRGVLTAGESKVIEASIWVEDAGLIGLGGWELEVETGEDVEGVWRVRRSWTRSGEGGWVEVVSG